MLCGLLKCVSVSLSLKSEGCSSAWALTKMNFQNVVQHRAEIMFVSEETNQEEESLCLTVF